MFFLRKKNKITIKDFYSENKTENIRLVSFSGFSREKIIEEFNKNYLTEGDHIKNGGKAADKSILSLAGFGVGASHLSNHLSSNLFLATADPSNLMKIKNGFGSAVFQNGKIVTHAPFISASSAILPIAAPVLAFQAISTIMILDKFKGVNEKLVSIEKNIERLIERYEATILGRIISSGYRLANLEKEFKVTNHFSTDMIVRLSLIENEVNPLFERYRYLLDNNTINFKSKTDDIRFKNSDGYLVLILSILDLQLDMQKLKLSIQENPGYMSHAAKSLINKVDNYTKLWSNLEKDSIKIDEIIRDLSDAVEKMSWWSKNLPSWLLGQKERKDDIELRVKEFNQLNNAERIMDLSKNIDNAKSLGEEIENSLHSLTKTSLIYWEDEKGKHSYYTSDLALSFSDKKSLT